MLKKINLFKFSRLYSTKVFVTISPSTLLIMSTAKLTSACWAGDEADGDPANRQEQAAEGGIDDCGGWRGVLEGDAPNEADIIIYIKWNKTAYTSQ